jgi:hypothetical protein
MFNRTTRGTMLSKNDGKIITNLMSQRFALFVIRLTAVLLAVGFLCSCKTAVTPNAKMKPALAERLAALNTEEPMPPAEGSGRRDTPGSGSDSKSRLSSVAIVALFRGVDDALIHPRETRVLPARLRSPG